MYHQFKELAGVDITKQPMEVGPTAHYVMGGVKVDPETQESTVRGLFAAGEAATGLHGANRLGGNSLSDLVTFGRRAGLHAAKSATKIDSWTEIAGDDVDSAIAKMVAPLSRKGGEPCRHRQRFERYDAGESWNNQKPRVFGGGTG